MFVKKQFHNLINHLDSSNVPLSIRLWNGKEFLCTTDPKVTVEIPSIHSLSLLLKPSLDKLGQAYVEGKINVAGKARDIIGIANSFLIASPDHKNKVSKRKRRTLHNRKIDRDSISYHYDVSNEFYQQFLDDKMIYSCAYFLKPDDSLSMAQEQKLDHILTKLNLTPGKTLLDVGCGWGALIIHAAEKYGAKATGVTISKEQYELAKKRIREKGLEGKCTVLLKDYRDIKGEFDRITSIGMFEHVGFDYLTPYFKKLYSLLAPGGIVLNHGITSTNPHSGGAPMGGGAFIQRYVFPHGELPHISLTLQSMCEAGFEPQDVENLRRHYALTLDHWTERFESAKDRIASMVDEKQYRIWKVYLAGCAYAFHKHWVAIHQILASKPEDDALPLTRDYMYNS